MELCFDLQNCQTCKDNNIELMKWMEKYENYCQKHPSLVTKPGTFIIDGRGDMLASMPNGKMHMKEKVCSDVS